MRRVILVCAVAALLLGTLVAVPSAMGKAGGAKKTEVWFYQAGGTTLYEGIFMTTGSGIIHEWRPAEDLKLTFKPAAKFAEPDEGDWFLWTFHAADYTIDPDSPGALTDFFTEGAQYWVQITEQD